MSYYFESLFLVVIQVVMCVSILMSNDLHPGYTYGFYPDVCLFFTSLVLHFGCIAIIRNGIQMCKFVVYHSEEFSNPVEVFILGVLISLSNVLCEITNAVGSTS